MDADDLFARVERAIIDSRLLRDERRVLEQETAKARRALGSAVLEMANARAAMEANRSRHATRRDEPALPIEPERLECVTAYIQSQRDLLQALRLTILN